MSPLFMVFVLFSIEVITFKKMMFHDHCCISTSPVIKDHFFLVFWFVIFLFLHIFLVLVVLTPMPRS